MCVMEAWRDEAIYVKYEVLSIKRCQYEAEPEFELISAENLLLNILLYCFSEYASDAL